MLFQIPTTIIKFKEPFSWQQHLNSTLTEKMVITEILSDAINSSVVHTLMLYLKKYPWVISRYQSKK